MAFIPAVLAAIGTAVGASAAGAVGAGLLTVGSVVSAGVGIASAVGAFGQGSQKLPAAPALPATPTLQDAQAKATQQTQAAIQANAYGGGTTDFTLGGATINSSNIQVKSLLGA